MKRTGGLLAPTDYSKYDQIQKQRALLKRISDLEARVTYMEEKINGSSCKQN